MISYLLVCLLLANLPFCFSAPLVPTPGRREAGHRRWGLGDITLYALWGISVLLWVLAESLYWAALLGAVAAILISLSTYGVYQQPKRASHHALESLMMGILALLLSPLWAGASVFQISIAGPLGLVAFFGVWVLMSAPGIMWVYGLPKPRVRD